MAKQSRAKIRGPFQPKWIDYTGLGLLITGLTLIVLPSRRS